MGRYSRFPAVDRSVAPDVPETSSEYQEPVLPESLAKGPRPEDSNPRQVVVERGGPGRAVVRDGVAEALTDTSATAAAQGAVKGPVPEAPEPVVEQTTREEAVEQVASAEVTPEVDEKVETPVEGGVQAAADPAEPGDAAKADEGTDKVEEPKAEVAEEDSAQALLAKALGPDAPTLDALPAYEGTDTVAMSIDEVVEWVGSNSKRRAFALRVEEARGEHARKGLAERLT